jgi:23S rRNA (adenine2503-C2)-methyltransferase
VPTDVKSLTRDELAARFKTWEQPVYRVGQLLEWLYVRRATSWDVMTNLPKPLREKLGKDLTLHIPELVRKQGASDATQKFLWQLHDHSLIESVLIPANPALYGDASDRHTLCVSTQVGCAYGCKFCASGLSGWKRNLTPDEIVDQVLTVERWRQQQSKAGSQESDANSPSSSSSKQGEEPIAKTRTTTSERLVDNLVVMGMGEPLANYDNVLKALRILNAPWGGGIGARKITISTSGLAPQIRRLAGRAAAIPSGDFTARRDRRGAQQIMPVNRKYPLKELVAACEHYQGQKGRMLTFEYILIAGVNDSIEQIKPLAALGQTVREGEFDSLQPGRRPAVETPFEEVCEAFLAALEKQKVIATLRREKGGDIDAACGQLRLKTEREFGGAIYCSCELPEIRASWNSAAQEKEFSPFNHFRFSWPFVAKLTRVIALLDYGSGNLRSVHKALLKVGADVRIVQTPEEIGDARAMVLPGVGAFDDCINALRKQELLEAAREFIKSGKPFLGICVGYQALFEKSEEFNSPAPPGLGIFKGKRRPLLRKARAENSANWLEPA